MRSGLVAIPLLPHSHSAHDIMWFNLAILTVALGQFAATCAADDSEAFFATAIVTDAQNNSALECWQLNASVAISTGAGTAGATTVQLGNITNATYTLLPANYYGGIHNAPFPQ